MSTPSPLQPQGTLDGAPKSRVRITVLTILALHVVFVGGLLMQGCDRKGSPTAGTTDSTSNTLSSLPPLNSDTNGYYTAPPTDSFSNTGAAAAPATAGSGQLPAAGSQPGAGTAAQGSYAGTLPPAGTSSPGLGTAGSPYPGTAQEPAPGLSHNTLPPPPSYSAPSPGGLTTEHVIRKGDLIRDLAKKYGVTEQAILDANPGIKPRNLKVNDKITIPPPSATASSVSGTATTAHAATSDAPASGGETYVVKAGDNLTKIAKRYGVTVSQIRAANNMRNDRIVAKQTLKIPARSVPRQEPAANSAAPAF